MNQLAPQIPSFSFAGLKELQSRLLFVVAMLVVYRIGAYIPLPGLDPERIASLLYQKSSGFLNYFSIISGGALSRCSIFGLGLGPYITFSIFLQMLSYVVPSLEQLQKEGELGKRKLNQYTRYGTIALAILQSWGYLQILISYGVVTHSSFSFYVVGMATLTAGSVLLMWLGEQISDRGIGSGTSVIISAGIIAGLPSSIMQFIEMVRQKEVGLLSVLLVIAIIATVTHFVVFVERAQRKITVHYPKQQRGRHMYAAQSNHLPFKVNSAGIMPTILASHFLMIVSFLINILSWLGLNEKHPVLTKISVILSPGTPVHMLVLAFLISFFCFYYTALSLDPRKTADRLKKSGAFIPGIRPGEQSAQYIDTIITRLTVIGCIYLLLVVLLPEALVTRFNIPFAFGGTAFLIVIVVVIELIGQIQSLLMSYQYESLLKKAGLKGNFPIQ